MEEEKLEKEDYNKEPVLYCKNCMSLRIVDLPYIEDSDYCDECGSTDIATTDIHTWEQLYEKQYNHKYIEKY